MIRVAVPGDLAAVLSIASAGFSAVDRIGPAWLVRMLARPGTVLFVDKLGPDCVRGFVLVEAFQGGQLVRLIAVSPSHRRQGVGRGLLAKLSARVEAGAWVRVENAASRGMFDAAGWTGATRPSRRKGEWVYFVR